MLFDLDNESTESPRKRLKSSNKELQDDLDVIVETTSPPKTEAPSNESTEKNGALPLKTPDSKEVDVGIVHFVSSETSAFSGIMKKRCVKCLKWSEIPTRLLFETLSIRGKIK